MNILHRNHTSLMLHVKFLRLYVYYMRQVFSILNSHYALYYSLVYPYLFYCIAVWSSTHPTNLKRLVILQKRVVRIANKDGLHAHIDPIFAEPKLLRVDQIFLLQVASFTFRFENNLLPPFLDNYFPVARPLHQYNTRSINLYYIPLRRANFIKFSILYQRPKVYNSLNIEICNSCSFCIFKV